MTEVAARSFEFSHLPDRVFQFFEYAHQYRTIWVDGRSLPKEPEPRWMGYSVGRWDGDAFVVDTLGLDDRNWADMWGHPISTNARVQEPGLLLQADRNRDEGAPAAGGTAIDERMELFCVPSEEEAFNQAIRNPAGGVSYK
jgi:hypothetical protein